jgi:hypothetical protein
VAEVVEIVEAVTPIEEPETVEAGTIVEPELNRHRKLLRWKRGQAAWSKPQQWKKPKLKRWKSLK